MVTLVLLVALYSPFGFTKDYLPLPNPKPEDCIITPLANFPGEDTAWKRDPVLKS
jgi:hypothetical protein